MGFDKIVFERENMIFLDYHPAPPTTVKAAKEQNTTKAKRATLKQVMKTDDLSWQLKWMTDYDKLRKEFQDRLRKSEEISQQRLTKVEALEAEVTKIPMLTAIIAQREKQIRELVQKCETNENGTQTDEIERNEKSTQMNTVHIETFIQTDAMEITVSDNYVRNIHSYAQIGASTSSIQVFKYKCIDCGFATNKKSTYKTHVAENCVQKPTKNMECPVCKGLFTYHTLRLHLNHYVTGQYRPTGEHAKHTPFYHQHLLEQHKRLKTKK